MDRQHYDDLVSLYVDRVSQLEGVLGIVLFGSVSTPGLSDIDIVVTVADNGPWPEWEKISLRNIAQGHPAESVVAHDVFVWPREVAEKAESFFYVDQQTVLSGSVLGGNLDPDLGNSFSQLLSMDYLLHRFESLSSILTSRQVTLRSVILFISTLRHTCHLAAGLNLISQTASDQMVTDITDLRLAVLETGFTDDMLDDWPEKIIRLLWSVTLALASQLDLDNQTVSVRKWYSGPRQAFLNSDSKDGVDEWEECIRRQSSQLINKYVRAAPVPSAVYSHVQNYFEMDSPSGNYLSLHYPTIFGDHCSHVLTQARKLRVKSVIRHWQFLNESGYMSSSGKGYIGVGMPRRNTIKDKFLKQLCLLNTLRLPAMNRADNAK